MTSNLMEILLIIHKKIEKFFIGIDQKQLV